MEIFYVIAMLIFAISLVLMGVGNLLSLRQQNQNIIIRVPVPEQPEGGMHYPAYMDDPDYEPVTPIEVVRGKPDLRVVK